jgi:hypothetical protein
VGRKGKETKAAPREPEDEHDDIPVEVAVAGAQLGGSLLIALALSWGALFEVVQGRLPFTDAGLRFVGCFVVTRVGLGVIGAVYRSYRPAIDEREGRIVPGAGPLAARSPDRFGENR